MSRVVVGGRSQKSWHDSIQDSLDSPCTDEDLSVDLLAEKATIYKSHVSENSIIDLKKRIGPQERLNETSRFYKLLKAREDEFEEFSQTELSDRWTKR